MIILPFRGEFGIKLIYHVPAVHALEAESKVVCCEEGEEALYPSATRIITCPRNDDAERRDSSRSDSAFMEAFRGYLEAMGLDRGRMVEAMAMGGARGYFRPEPHVEQDVVGPIDVVVCPRMREYGREKNWPHWRLLAGRLAARGLRVFAVGSPDASDRSVEGVVPCSWHRGRFLDATIQAMRSARLVVATDSGLSHLAVWCGAPLVLISYEDGRIAPGPVRDGAGRVEYPEYWHIDRDWIRGENHLNSDVDILEYSWHRPDLVEDFVVGRGLGSAS
jgi:hypothetical protein